MPYIFFDDREDLDEGQTASTPGELNYKITTEILRYLPSNPNYAEFNAVIGVLECAKLELYRRMIAPYEDDKKERNGDVF